MIVIDEVLTRTGKYRLPPLAVGMGIYLPMALTLLVPVGALIGWLYERWAERAGNPEFAKRMGVLAATGLIVGESLFGVAFAGIVGTISDAPLAVVGEHSKPTRCGSGRSSSPPSSPGSTPARRSAGI